MSQLANDDTQDFYARGARQSMGDSQGFFKFEEVKDGEYFVITTISWQLPNSYIPEGGHLMTRVRPQGGKTVEAMLSPY